MLRNTALAVAIAAALVACGGGSGTTSPDTTTPSSSTPATLSGGAAKGIIKQGIVTAVELDSNGGVLLDSDGKEIQIGSATTNSDGEYSLTLNSSYTGGAVLIKLTAGANTKMICDALNGCAGSIARGQDFTPPTGFELRAITPPAGSGATVSVQVTPFSHMAAANAINTLKENGSGVTPAKAVSDAVGKMKNVTGLDINSVKPVDITANDIGTKSIQEQRYALLNAAFADVAYGNNTDNLLATLENYAEEFQDGDFDADDGNGSQEEDLKALLDNLKSQSDSPDVSVSDESKSDVNGFIEITNDKTNDDGSFDPAVVEDSGSSKVDQAKALLTETRTWISSFDDLQSPADAFAVDVDTVTATLSNETNAVLDVALKGVETGLNAFLAALESETTFMEPIPVGDIGFVQIDEVDLDGKTMVKLSSSDLAGVAIDFTVDVDKTLSVFDQPLDGQTISVGISGSAKNAKVEATVSDAVLAVAFAAANTDAAAATTSIDAQPNDDEPVVSSIDLEGDLSLKVLNAGVVTGESLTGTGKISLVSLNEGVAEGWRTFSGDDLAHLSLKQIKLDDVTVTNAAGSSTGLSINLSIDNAAALDTFAYLEGGNNVFITKYSNSDLFGFSSYQGHGIFDLRGGSFGRKKECCSSEYETTFSGLNEFYQMYDAPPIAGDVLGIIPAVVEMIQPSKYANEDSIKYLNVFYSSDYFFGSHTNVYMTLEVSAKESLDSFLKGSLTIGADMALQGYPEANAAITFNRTGLKAGSVNTKLAYNGHMLDITVSRTDDAGTGTVTVTNADGVEMIVSVTNGEATSGSVTVDGESVGTIATSESGITTIRYTDGTFESL